MKTILVVEDDAEVRRLFEKLLTSKGRVLSKVATGVDALASMRHQCPDLIVLDFFLPDMVAMNFMARAREICPGVPIVIVSSFWNMKYARMAIQDGAVDFIPKPIDPAQLIETVNIRLGVKGSP